MLITLCPRDEAQSSLCCCKSCRQGHRFFFSFFLSFFLFFTKTYCDKRREIWISGWLQISVTDCNKIHSNSGHSLCGEAPRQLWRNSLSAIFITYFFFCFCFFFWAAFSNKNRLASLVKSGQEGYWRAAAGTESTFWEHMGRGKTTPLLTARVSPSEDAASSPGSVADCQKIQARTWDYFIPAAV